MITSHMHVFAPGFPRHERDDDLVNDFMSGYALASGIMAELKEQGYAGVKLIPEDYGWFVLVSVPVGGTELSVTISSMADFDEDKDNDVEAMVAIQPQKLTKGMLWWKKDVSDEIRAAVEEFSNVVFGFLRENRGIEIVKEYAEI